MSARDERAVLRQLRRDIAKIEGAKYARLWFHPGRSGGTVCLEGTGVMAAVIGSRFMGGDSIRAIATDYDANPKAVEQAARLVSNALRTRRTPETVFKAWQQQIRRGLIP